MRWPSLLRRALLCFVFLLIFILFEGWVFLDGASSSLFIEELKKENARLVYENSQLRLRCILTEALRKAPVLHPRHTRTGFVINRKSPAKRLAANASLTRLTERYIRVQNKMLSLINEST